MPRIPWSTDYGGYIIRDTAHGHTGTKRPYTEASPKQDISSEVGRIGAKHRVFAGDAERGYVTPSPGRKGSCRSSRHANPDPTSWSHAYISREGFELHVHMQKKCKRIQNGFEMLQLLALVSVMFTGLPYTPPCLFHLLMCAWGKEIPNEGIFACLMFRLRPLACLRV